MGFLSGLGWGDALGFVGGILGDKATSSANAANASLQREMAQNGIRWRVEDAKAAGISPIAALGAQTSSPTIGVMANTSTANALQNAGQALKEKKLNDLNAQLLESQIANNNAQSKMYLAEAQEANSRASVALNPANPPAAASIFTPLGDFKTSNTTKQQDVEDEYGGIVGEVYGVGRAINDWYQNAKPSLYGRNPYLRNPSKIKELF